MFDVIDDPERLAEQVAEECAARQFKITVEALRQQRRELGQLLTGPYAGCSPGFASMMTGARAVQEIFARLREDSVAHPCG